MGDEDKVRGLSPYDFDRLLRAALILLGSAFDGGTATTGSQTTLQDTSKNWRTNVWAGGLIKVTIDSIDYLRLVSANTADTLTFDALPASIAVALGNKYALSRVVNIADISSWGGTTLTGRDISLDLAKLDITLSVLARQERWGRDVSPAWTHNAEQTAPGAGTALVTQAVTAGKSGYIYGFFISAQEANDFLLNWTSGGAAKSKRIVFGGSGTTEVVDPIPMNEGLPADAGSNITITNVNAGGAGKVYQANLLYGEV